MNKKTIVNILWTAGWDSTFRMILLAEKDVMIQPYYLFDKKRKSSFIEIDSIKAITDEVVKLDTTKCEILPLKIINVLDVPENIELTMSFHNLRKQMFMGGQYDWLSRFSKLIPGLELCIHKDDTAYEVIKAFGIVKQVYDETGTYFVIDKSNSTLDVINVFGNFRFPLLNFSKLDMKEVADAKGCQFIMNKTWFCHNPINNEPCGICNPCRYTIEEGMGFRLPNKALQRYKTEKRLEKYTLYRHIRKIRKRIIGY